MGLTGGLLSACALLAVIVYLELDGVSFSGSATAAAASSIISSIPEVKPTQELNFLPRSAFNVITERPLFRRSRRPPAPAAAAAPAIVQPPPEPGGFRLRGVIVGGNRRLALIENRETGGLVRVGASQIVDGWRVTSITPLAVVLEQSGVQEVLELR